MTIQADLMEEHHITLANAAWLQDVRQAGAGRCLEQETVFLLRYVTWVFNLPLHKTIAKQFGTEAELNVVKLGLVHNIFLCIMKHKKLYSKDFLARLEQRSPLMRQTLCQIQRVQAFYQQFGNTQPKKLKQQTTLITQAIMRDLSDLKQHRQQRDRCGCAIV